MVFDAGHLGIAFGVGLTLTGSVAVAGALTLVELTVNTVAHYFFDRWWERRQRGTGGLALRRDGHTSRRAISAGTS